MKPKIKKCVKFGTGSHIVMDKEDVGKKFLVLPESSKYILSGILKQYHENLKEHINPLLSEFLTRKDFEIIKSIYEKLLKGRFKGYNSGIYKRFLKSNYEDLDKFRLSNIGTILNDIEENLPEKLKKKLLAEFYKE